MQPVPQLTLHEFFELQLNVALLGGATAAPPSAPPPSEQVPPDAHVHVEPLQEQSPLHASSPPDAEPPEHPRTTTETNAGTARSLHMAWSMPLDIATVVLRAEGAVSARARVCA